MVNDNFQQKCKNCLLESEKETELTGIAADKSLGGSDD